MHQLEHFLASSPCKWCHVCGYVQGLIQFKQHKILPKNKTINTWSSVNTLRFWRRLNNSPPEQYSRTKNNFDSLLKAKNILIMKGCLTSTNTFLSTSTCSSCFLFSMFFFFKIFIAYICLSSLLCRCILHFFWQVQLWHRNPCQWLWEVWNGLSWSSPYYYIIRYKILEHRYINF